MSDLLILIRESAAEVCAAQAILPAICPYLETFGGSAKSEAARPFRGVRSGELTSAVTAIEVTLSGAPRVDRLTLISKLERFVKQTAKDAELEASFEFLLLDPGRAGADGVRPA